MMEFYSGTQFRGKNGLTSNQHLHWGWWCSFFGNMKHPSNWSQCGMFIKRFSWVKNGAASYPYKNLSVELVRACPNVFLCQVFVFYLFAAE